MPMKKQSAKLTRRPKKDLTPRKTEDVRGGRDAASGLPTGKRTYKP